MSAPERVPGRSSATEPAPAEVEYGGSKQLQGLARVLDNVRVLREFKNDDRAASLAVLIELSTALEESERVPEWGARLRRLSLTMEERRQVASAVADPTLLKPWMPATA